MNDWSDVDADPMADQLRAALAAKAAEIEVRAGRFDLRRPPLRLVTDVTATLSPSPRRFRLVLAGAAALALVVAAAAVAVRSDRGHPTATPSASTTTGASATPPTTPVPDGVLTPGPEVPPDLTLWSVGWSSRPLQEGLVGIEQLFGPADGDTAAGSLLLRVQVGGGGPVGLGPTAVRGTVGDLAPAKDVAGASTLTWSEAGATVDASFRGLTVADAVAFLDRLTWRTDDPLAGFGWPPDRAGPILLGERTAAAPDPTTVGTRFVYLDGDRRVAPGAGRQLAARTVTITNPAAPTDDGTTVASSYLQTWFRGGPGPGGSMQSFDPVHATLRRDWPDGRSLWLDANRSAVTEVELRAVADGIAPAPAADLAALRDKVRARVGRHQVLAGSADLGLGTVEVRGDAPTRALCLVLPGRRPLCPAEPLGVGAGDGGEGLVGGFLVDGTWYVVVATTTGPPTITGPDPADGLSPLPGAASATAGPWHVTALAVPGDLDEVIVTGAGSVIASLLRATADQP